MAVSGSDCASRCSESAASKLQVKRNNFGDAQHNKAFAEAQINRKRIVTDNH